MSDTGVTGTNGTDVTGTLQHAGRSLDFLCQEINREFNTIGSKANSSAIAQLVDEGKATAEKLREQVQNVE